MYLEKELIASIQLFLDSKFNLKVLESEIKLLSTKKNFKGDLTFASFSLINKLRLKPEDISKILGDHLKENCDFILDYNIVGGFLNLIFKDSYLVNNLLKFDSTKTKSINNNSIVIIEFPSPNTNKPLHLGHLRNMFLGMSIGNILEYAGYKVKKVNLVNDRGIHICKSMVAYKKFGNNETPDSDKIKGDHFVGKYYVKFDQELKKELSDLNSKNLEDSKLIKEAKEMLLKWEEGDNDVRKLWVKMNDWVYKGFNETFKKLNIQIDKTYYESDTYLLGKEIIKEGLTKNIFYKKEDGSVWIDLSDVGLDDKLLLRADGTSVYITQDIGTADKRFEDFKFNKSIYIVGNEQDYHFKVLFSIMRKLGRAFANDMYHLSYGMVDLPSGKMKSREGTVVDADNLIDEMINTAKFHTNELGKIDNFSIEEARKLYEQIGIGALKYFLLKIDPKKRMLFDPKASIDFHGDTGPFIQYTYARIFNLLEKAKSLNIDYLNLKENLDIKIEESEREIILHINTFIKNLKEAINNYSPAFICHYVFNLSKLFNKLYGEKNFLKEKNESLKSFRLLLAYKVAELIKINLKLLGIECPNRM
ncbi:MAG: arginine--tRNA ligase [Bacteroidetes bacterium]|nr:arginine--tRNA ligase [Bacteroidota bacterium]